VALRKNEIYCKAGFSCEFKRLEHTKKKANQKRCYFVLCEFDGACNQQIFERVVKERKEE